MRLIDADSLREEFDNEIELDSYWACKAIDKWPTIDAEPVIHATWYNIGNGMCRCSNCNRMKAWNSKYCPDCGAKMDLDPTAQ